MTLYKCFDAAFPPQSAPPGAQAVLGYIGRPGQTPHVWTLAEWQRFGHLRQYPAWVPDFGNDPDREAVEAVLAALNLGWAPHQQYPRAIVCDAETTQNPDWYARWAARIDSEGFTSVEYGSLSTIDGNHAKDEWVASWDGLAVLPAWQDADAKQYQAGAAWEGVRVDLSVIDQWLWDRGGQGPRHG